MNGNSSDWSRCISRHSCAVTSLCGVLFLSGCAGSLEKMSSWMGVSQLQLEQQLGAPDRMHDAPYGQVQTWYRNPDEAMGCSDQFTINGGVVTGYASNCGIWGGFGAPTPRR